MNKFLLATTLAVTVSACADPHAETVLKEQNVDPAKYHQLFSDCMKLYRKPKGDEHRRCETYAAEVAALPSAKQPAAPSEIDLK